MVLTIAATMTFYPENLAAKNTELLSCTTYSVGSSGYTFSTAMMEAIQKNEGIKVKVVPAGTDAFVAEGILEGRITHESRGAAGFGYDPVFELPHLGRTLAEVGAEVKNSLSHRFRALVEIRELLLREGLVAGGSADPELPA